MGFNRCIRLSGILTMMGFAMLAFVGQAGAQFVSPAYPTITLGTTLQFDVMSKTQLPLQGVKKVASGPGWFTCALMLDGTVKCWGANDRGQLGVGSSYSGLSAPITAVGLNHVTDIALGYRHVCALISDGTMKCWGANSSGQLGIGTVKGTTRDAYSPTAVTGLSGPVVGIAAGKNHSCAVILGGSVECWGDNGGGQLGNSTMAPSPVPVQVAGLSFATSIAAGDSHSCALEASGDVYCWGTGISGQLGNGPSCPTCNAGANSSSPVQSWISGVKAIAAAGGQTCALWSASGEVYCWGEDTVHVVLTPTWIGLSGAKTLAMGGTHACALLASGTVDCWGENENGQLGDLSYIPSFTPVPVRLQNAQDLSGVISIGAGGDMSSGPQGLYYGQSYAVLANGTVMTWGIIVDNNQGSGYLGTTWYATSVEGYSLPKQGARQLVTGLQDTCAVMGDGTVECWGVNTTGQLGSGNVQPSSIPVKVVGINNAISVGVGEQHACALLADGSVQCWGDNSSQQIPGCLTTSCLQPSIITSVQGAVAISANGFHTCALIVDGSVNCWGENSSVSASQCTPTNCFNGPVSGVSQAVAITAGFTHSCVSFANGEVSCWGQTGGGGPEVPPTLVPNTGGWQTWVTSLAAGDGLTCAVVVDGSALCWGTNSSGQLGNGTTTNSSVPVLVSNLTTARAISGDFATPCAVTANGSLVCWGFNGLAELGNGTTASFSWVPLAVAGLSGVAGTSSGAFTSSALLDDGTVQNWGDGVNGGLGNGTTGVAWTPVPTTPLVQTVWSSGKSSVVSINPSTGLATGLTTGATTVQASGPGLTVSTGVSVR